MIGKGIQVRWQGPTAEYVPLDPNAASRETPILWTVEDWGEEGIVTYRTKSEFRLKGRGRIEIRLHYRKDQNPHLDPGEHCWGTAIYRFSQNDPSGEVEWRDDDYPEEHNGLAAWTTTGPGLVAQKTKKATRALHKENQRLRTNLLALEPMCALTGETTSDALEAAHLIPAEHQGSEVVDNAILLRADVHRLLDAGAFDLSVEGKVKSLQPRLSSSYRRLLRGRALGPLCRLRVHRALRERQRRGGA